VGPEYIRELRGPFERIPMLAVGGVTLANLGAYFRAGAAGVGVGAALFGAEALRAGNLGEITKNVRTFVGAVAKAAGPSSG
jgi:2-dehydro-3-deoxyphosphogluconate aldolase/(4S)-4-hydroxy-2-oxoglutarate aldolase